MVKVIAITGVSGHFGRALLPLLDKDPEVDRIIGISRRPPSLKIDKLVFHSCDVRDPKIGELFTGVDTVVHLAFMIFHDPGKEAEADDVNINGSRNVFEAAARAGVHKLVVASSIAAYGVHPDNDQPITEESSIRGNEDFYYSRAKAANERYLDSFCLRHPDMIVTRLRPCIVIGPSVDPARIASYERTTYFKSRGPEYPMNYVHEEDLASAFYLAIKRDAPGAFNVAGPEPELPTELARSVGMKVRTMPRSLLKFMLWLEWRRGKTPVPPSWVGVERGPMVVSTAKIERELGWRPKYTTRQALVATLEAMRALPKS